ncbi:MAG: carboxymuconolactone decarboxylase family protein [Proteobacteria bacterium]|nr:carboxymuconolactone decarboxylase family protein [Pseudomonadota bacterium]
MKTDVEPSLSVAPRIGWAEFEQALPGAVAGLRALSDAVNASGLDNGLTELLKVRVSQINGCAFCLKLHLDWARKAGVRDVQLDLVATWRDAACFNARQRAALRWAEALTAMAAAHVDDGAYAEVARQYTQRDVAALTAAIAAINAWNRIAGGLRFAPPGV